MKKKNLKSLLEHLVSILEYLNVNMLVFAVPEKFYGSGNIRIKGVKQVQVTNDYLRLDMQTRGCQIESTYEDCVTDLYLDMLNEECNCLPFNLKNFSKHDDIVKVAALVFRMSLISNLTKNLTDKNLHHRGGEEMC